MIGVQKYVVIIFGKFVFVVFLFIKVEIRVYVISSSSLVFTSTVWSTTYISVF